jgi:hypothetical protein
MNVETDFKIVKWLNILKDDTFLNSYATYFEAFQDLMPIFAQIPMLRISKGKNRNDL